MKYSMVLVCVALASFNFKSNCLPSRATDNPCQDQPNGSYLDHPSGCKHFIVCNNGQMHNATCGYGFAFSVSRPPCDLAVNVGCFEEPEIIPSTATPPTTTPPTTAPLTTAPSTTTPSTTTPTTTTPTTTTPTTTTPTTTTPTTTTPTTTTTTTTTPSTTTPTTTTPTTTTTTTTTLSPTVPITISIIPSTTTRIPTTTTRIPTTTTRIPTTTTQVKTTLPQLPATTTQPFTPRPTTTRPELTTEYSTSNIPAEINCPEQENSNQIVFLPSNHQCSKYYICYHNKPIEMMCAPNLHWNTKTERCDTIEEAECTVSSMPKFFPVCPRDSIRMYPHPLNCEWFLYCYHGFMTVQQCPFFYNWDSESESCQLKTMAKCVLHSE